MICQKCQEEGKKSKVYGGGGTRTATYYATFYDESGILHNHDDSILNRFYECSEGHKFRVTGGQSCPNCDWKTDQKIEFA